MPAYVLSEEGPRSGHVPADGSLDDISYEGDIELAADGSAEVELVQTLHGKYATALRGGIAEMAQHQIRDLVESRILGYALRGAHLEKYELVHLEDPDLPLVIRTRSKVTSFAQVAGNVLLIAPPFAPRVSQLAALPARQTPLLIPEATDQKIVLRIHLPPGSTLAASIGTRDVSDGEYRVSVRDREQGNTVLLDREIHLPAGRVQVAEYPDFLRFARSADDALSSSVRIRVGARQ
jgi:hypothetical protein